MNKLANPCIKEEIIGRLATGEPSNKIALDYNVSGQRIRQIRRRENQSALNN